jgi:hypothetical protein
VTWTVSELWKLHDSVDVLEPVTLVGVRVHAVLLLDRLTRPLKLFRELIVMVEVPVEPARTVTDPGLAVIVKSWTM